ncbi:hypothetical protein [Gordonia phage MerCougar]|nr:hypothetical protein [Gordonia phage MerCougar]
MIIVNRVPTLKPTPMCQSIRPTKTRIGELTLVCRLKDGHPGDHWWISPRSLPSWQRMSEREKLLAKRRTELMDRAFQNRQSRSAQLMQDFALGLARRD